MNVRTDSWHMAIIPFGWYKKAGFTGKGQIGSSGYVFYIEKSVSKKRLPRQTNKQHCF